MLETPVESIYQKIHALSERQLDELPHGAIQLDKHGKILSYNRFESALSGVPRETAIGKNFFRDIAPCTDVARFHGRFLEGVAKKKLHEKFRYHFAFKARPRDVLITLFYNEAHDTVWVFVNPLD
jgi:photoactive yellow protein